MPSDTLESWRARAIALCNRRGWSLALGERYYKHGLEVAEFAEALRGKKGDPVAEAGDAIFTLMAMIPESISLVEVEKVNRDKITRLMEAPPYAGEDRKHREGQTAKCRPPCNTCYPPFAQEPDPAPPQHGHECSSPTCKWRPPAPAPEGPTVKSETHAFVRDTHEADVCVVRLAWPPPTRGFYYCGKPESDPIHAPAPEKP